MYIIIVYSMLLTKHFMLEQASSSYNNQLTVSSFKSTQFTQENNTELDL